MGICVRRPGEADEMAFLTAVERSTALHRPFVDPPNNRERYRAYIARIGLDQQDGFLVLHNEELAGVVNINEIVRGCFHSAYLGFYALEPWAGRGVMKQGLANVISLAFKDLGLHRLEANIQPQNGRSIGLVKRLGFRKEGFSPKYLKIYGEWRDHERWAITSEDWVIAA